MTPLHLPDDTADTRQVQLTPNIVLCRARWQTLLLQKLTGGPAFLFSQYFQPNTATPQPVALLQPFGTFASVGTVYDTSAAAGCNAITIGGTSAQLSALTVSNLQNWQCSIHEYITTYPSGAGQFQPQVRQLIIRLLSMRSSRTCSERGHTDAKPSCSPIHVKSIHKPAY